MSHEHCQEATLIDPHSWDFELNPEQVAAASQFGAHARLLAGPGTGKTHTLARRVVYLVTQRDVQPSEILVLTFTRLTTYELRSKIRSQLSQHTPEMPYIATLHSFALRQLMANAALVHTLLRPLRIADDWEEDEVITDDLKRMLQRNAKAVEDGFKRLSADWETLKADTEDWRTNVPDAPFLGAWEEHRRTFGYTLRAELVYQLKKAMEQIPTFRLTPNFSHVLIDEYQDLNPCDLAVAKSITQMGAALTAVGDDDQSIYGFRWANPEGIRNFMEHYPGSANLGLTECRRCGPRILDAATRIAAQDHERIPKDIHSEASLPEGNVQLLGFQSGGNEANGIARMCKRRVDAGTRPGEILVLLKQDRNKAYSRPLQEALNRLDVAVSVDSDDSTVLDEKPGRLVLTTLQLLLNPRDHLAWRSRINLVARLGESTVIALYGFARDEGVQFGDVIARLDDAIARVPAASRGILQSMVDQTHATIAKYADAIRDLGGGSIEEQQTRLLDIVFEIAAGEITEDEDLFAVRAHLQEVAERSRAYNLEGLMIAIAVGQEAFEAELNPDTVNILTMHRAKGLTATVVFVMAVEDQLIPRDETARTVADERRLLYVSMTRARHELILTYAGERRGAQQHSGRPPHRPQRSLSRFLTTAGFRATSGEAFVAGEAAAV